MGGKFDDDDCSLLHSKACFTFEFIDMASTFTSDESLSSTPPISSCLLFELASCLELRSVEAEFVKADAQGDFKGRLFQLFA